MTDNFRYGVEILHLLVRTSVRMDGRHGGFLQRGPAVLVSPVPLNPAKAGVPSLLRPGRVPQE